MKTIIAICATILFAASVFAQAPNKMSYQAIIRNNSNALVSNQAVGMQVSILQGSSSGTAIFIEMHKPTTNANGLASFEIGGGQPLSGSFSGINWGAGPYYIKTETDPAGGTNYTITSSTQLLSVPYALFSANGTPGPQGLQGIPGTNGNDGAVNAWGLSGNSGTSSTNNFIGTIDDQPLMFKVNNSSSGFIGSKQTSTSYGYLSLSNLKTGLYNTSIGYKSLNSSVNGSYNTSVGYEALKNATGTENTAVGYHALYSVTSSISNTAVGTEALLSNTASANTAVGFRALRENTTGDGMVAIGTSALYLNTFGNNNTSVGQSSLFNNSTGSDNTAIGQSALVANTTGSKNTAIGTGSGVSTNNLNKTTAIGYNAIVATSSSMVLGGTGVDAINVGIGTTSPARTLHINAVMRLEPIPTAPTSPGKGDIYFDSTLNKLRVYDGTTWQNCW